MLSGSRSQAQSVILFCLFASGSMPLSLRILSVNFTFSSCSLTLPQLCLKDVHLLNPLTEFNDDFVFLLGLLIFLFGSLELDHPHRAHLWVFSQGPHVVDGYVPYFPQGPLCQGLFSLPSAPHVQWLTVLLRKRLGSQYGLRALILKKAAFCCHASPS